MKIIYKGRYENEKQLPKGILPPNAIKFKEPETPEKLAEAAIWFLLPTAILAALIVLGSFFLHGRLNAQFSVIYFLVGALLSLLTLFPHELLHAVCFGKNAEVELYIMPKQFMAFVCSVQPVTKMRFIFLSLLPNLIFGWIPLIIWALMPYTEIYSDILFSFSVMSVTHGIGDYLNVFNASRQMPKGSMQQLSGFNSYWFMP